MLQSGLHSGCGPPYTSASEVCLRTMIRLHASRGRPPRYEDCGMYDRMAFMNGFLKGTWPEAAPPAGETVASRAARRTAPNGAVPSTRHVIDELGAPGRRIDGGP